MNYGITLLAKGDAQTALDYFRRAATFTPNYHLLDINTAIAYGVLNRPAESESHFLRAIQLQPQDAQPYFYYGRWLASRGRTDESVRAAKTAIELNPAFIEARYLLMQAYLDQAQSEALSELAYSTLQLVPNDPATLAYLARNDVQRAAKSNADKASESQSTPEGYLGLSLLHYRAGRYQDCIKAAKKALQLRPNYAEAYNNIAAAHQAMSQWNAAIDAARRALELKPDFVLARNNLAWSRAQRELNKR
jgi:tetratricopeptide (TPR) repeat protein